MTTVRVTTGSKKREQHCVECGESQGVWEPSPGEIVVCGSADCKSRVRALEEERPPSKRVRRKR